jgi:hypothetical protein
MAQARFRWVTVQRALDLLVADHKFTNAKAIAFIEEIGCGPDADRLSAKEKTTPKLRNLISRACREEPPRMDTEGLPLADRVVREAASYIPDPEPPEPWDKQPQTPPPLVTAFLNSLAVDGWGVQQSQLVPNTAVPIAEQRSRLRKGLEDGSAVEALRRLDQLEKGLDEGHWESANSDARGFLNAVFDTIVERHPQSRGQGLKEGAARVRLQEVGFFKPDARDPKKSYEGRYVQALADLLGSDGAHTGASDGDAAVFRYSIAIITADYFLARAGKI